MACDLEQIAQIKQNINIPVIANGDIHDHITLQKAITTSHCDAFMIARAGSGRPWLYQEFLEQRTIKIEQDERIKLFIRHLDGLACLEDEFKAVLQSKSLVRYYFRQYLHQQQLEQFYKLHSMDAIELFLQHTLIARELI